MQEEGLSTADLGQWHPRPPQRACTGGKRRRIECHSRSCRFVPIIQRIPASADMEEASEKGYTETWARRAVEAKVPLPRIMKEVARRLLEYKPERKEDDWRLIPAEYRMHPIAELADVSHKRYEASRNLNPTPD